MRLHIPDATGPIITGAWAIEEVPPDQAGALWERCWQLFQRAIRRFPHVPLGLTSGGLLVDVFTRRANLWIAWDRQRERVQGAAITRIIVADDMPGKRLCEYVLWSGEGLKEWGGQMFAVIRAWARANDCDCIVWSGRRGWQRLFGGVQVGASDPPSFVIDLKE